MPSTKERLCLLAISPLLLCFGCPKPVQPEPARFLPKDEAIARVNANNARIDGAVQAKRVSARGHCVTDTGTKRSFDLSGGMLYLAPRHLYCDLKQLGQTVMRIGSNPGEYWLWFQPEVDTLWWGHYAALEQGDAVGIPLRPDQIIQALGQAALDTDRTCLYRVMGAHHQLLYFEPAPDGERLLTKEYWLDRRPPFLIRKLLFRDRAGCVTFYAELDDYRPIRDAEALVAHRLTLRWPVDDATINLRVGEWVPRPNVTPDSSAFRRLPDRPRTILTDPVNLSDSPV